MGFSKSLFAAAARTLGTRRVYNVTAEVRRKELALELRAAFGNKVLYGPFRGMVVPDAASRFDGDVSAK